MFNSEIKSKYPFVTEFFESAINTQNAKVSHAYLFTGSDIFAQYILALNVAMALNCEKKSEEMTNCDCLNCSWIRENKHPAVITVSPIDYNHAKEGSKTVISVDQARELRRNLAISSNYHRIVIFIDAVEGDEFYTEKNEKTSCFKDFNFAPPYVNKEEERIWLPRPLNHSVLADSAANALLKTIEEPGEKITFFFLTKDKEDVINTIVSRCQAIPVANINLQKTNYSHLKDVLDGLPPKNPKEAIYIAERILELSKEKSLGLVTLLNAIQAYFSDLLKENSSNRFVSLKIIETIKNIEKAKLQSSSYVNSNSLLESLFLSMV